ncbi:MAG: ATP synthase F1 subunit epsilon [Micavibrio sp.]|nr:ATP synthase F1 subunit epsilon [Micavibrio sp.]HCK32062.1 ATP synthase F1 subunit epsilon [Rhodospirillaceae bacterium]|tara:strand:- start:1454 stop:1873 length:420 start_codon:yes stop_codon:yes gene_type:complete
MSETGNNAIQFELVSPEARLMDEPAVMVVLPGTDGDIGVLPEHSPLVSTMRAGVVSIYKENKTTVTDQIFLAGGFADVTGERVTVLAEEAIPVSKIDIEEVQKQIDAYKADLANGSDKTHEAEHLAILEAKLVAVQNAA